MEKSLEGKLIVIEGTDGAGKETQTHLLAENLRKKGYEVEVADFPRYGKKSAWQVEKYLNGEYGDPKETGAYIPSIFYACDRYDASFKIREWLSQGKIVICNRYVSASMGHQAGKIQDLKERDEYLEWIDNLEFNILKIPRPNKTILLYVPPEVGQKNVEKKGKKDYINGDQVHDIHTKDLNHLKEAAEAFLYVAKKYGWTIIECAPTGTMKQKEEITNEILEKIKDINP